MTTHFIDVNAAEVAQALALRISPLLIEPTRFKPNNGKCLTQYGKPGTETEGMLLIKAELPGHFAAEFTVNLADFAHDAEATFNAVADELQEAQMAAMDRRHNERRITHSLYSEMKP